MRIPAPHSAAPNVVSHLQDAALRAGLSASRDVFAADPERTDADVVAPKSNRELRTICLADREREHPQGESDCRAGVHTKNCAAILDACTDVCWARWPRPAVQDEGLSVAEGGFLLLLGVAGFLGLVWLAVQAEEAGKNGY